MQNDAANCVWEHPVRTTLTIDDDVLAAARELATTRRNSVGAVISSLVRTALKPACSPPKTRNGVPLLASGPGSRPITSEFVKQLEEELMLSDYARTDYS
jgi:hypothetical protein